MPENNDSSSRHLLTVVVYTFGLLLLMSAIPWGKLTNNSLKDFNLFEDLFPTTANIAATTTSAIVDPELEELMSNSGEQSSPENSNTSQGVVSDTISADTVVELPAQISEAPIIDGSVAIENYSRGTSLAKFRQALSEARNRTVRIAIIGDSYIEGDIFSSNLRDLLQQRYGGSGVGFMNAHCEFPGFRQTVGQRSRGWTMHDIRSMSRKDSIRTLSCDYGVASGKASSGYDGKSKFATTTNWQKTSFVFLAPDSGTVTISGSDGLKITKSISPSPLPQAVVLEGATSKADISVNVPGLIALGAYLDGATGVQVDCMSIRGNSGLSISRMNRALCRHMAQWADYDLIIVEYGMNVLSAKQTDYTPYMENMIKGISHLQSCYPNADIIIMGVGDRGVKIGTEVQSLPTVTAMVYAQRETARRSGTHFWDTRAAMGGDRAVVDWRKRKLLNADYIHLNHAGGAELANLFDKALKHEIDE